jgi:hypothetical protein
VTSIQCTICQCSGSVLWLLDVVRLPSWLSIFGSGLLLVSSPELENFSHEIFWNRIWMILLLKFFD